MLNDVKGTLYDVYTHIDQHAMISPQQLTHGGIIYMNQEHQPDNIVSRLPRVYIADKTFTRDDGQVVEYRRLVIEFYVAGKLKNVELNVSPDKLTLLEVSDPIPGNLTDTPQ